MNDKPHDRDQAAERLAETAERDRNAWQRTLMEMASLAEERRNDGWTAVTIAAGHTAPEPPDAGDTDRFGFVYVIPGDIETDLLEVVNNNEYPEYNFYRNDLGNRAFILTEIIDSDARSAIFVAGSYDRIHEQSLINAVKSNKKMFTYLQKLDGTVLMAVEHEDYSRFFPTTL